MTPTNNSQGTNTEGMVRIYQQYLDRLASGFIFTSSTDREKNHTNVLADDFVKGKVPEEIYASLMAYYEERKLHYQAQKNSLERKAGVTRPDINQSTTNIHLRQPHS